jgi:Zinc finger, C2H2 type
MSGNTNRLRPPRPPMHPPPRSRPSASAERAHHATASSDQVSPAGASLAKPYSCDFPGCEKSFANKSALKSHEDVHSNERKFQCNIGKCYSIFKREYDLKRHNYYEHINPGSFKCVECKRIFNYRNLLNTHSCNPYCTKPKVTCHVCHESVKEVTIDGHMRRAHGMTGKDGFPNPNKMPVFGVLNPDLNPDASSSGASTSNAAAPAAFINNKKRLPSPIAEPAAKHRKKDDVTT